MQIEVIDIDKIHKYEKNAKRHPKKQIEQIKKSIQEFNYNDPIAIDENNMIIEGHGRYEALKELGYKQVECIRLTHLSEQEKKAYILAHNKLNMETGFDDELLWDELGSIVDFKMDDFGFNLDKAFDNLFKENEAMRTVHNYNLDIVQENVSTNDFWQMPIIENNNVIPKQLIELNSLNVEKNTKHYNTTKEEAGIHFFMDDYKLERLWNNPEKYIDALKEYRCVLTPMFSLYLDMPMPMKIWNIYRGRQLGQYYQRHNINVIPTIYWGEKETYQFCFAGIPKKSIIAVSTISMKRNKELRDIWADGMRECIKAIEPSTILLYGGKIDFDFGNNEVIEFKNLATERMKQGGKTDG